MLLDVVLWIILVGIIAIVPVGCFMTRSKSKHPHSPAH